MIEWVDPRYADVVEFFKKACIGGSTHCPQCYGVRNCVVINMKTGDAWDYWTCPCIPEAYLEGPHGQ